MRKSICSIFMLVFLLFVTGCTEQATKEQAEAGIVVICPEIVQILDRLEVDAVIGIVDMEDLPARYKEVAIIGTPETLDIAAIEELKPSLVLGGSEHEETQAPLFVERRMDSAFINLSNTTEMMQSIRELGPLIEREEEANELVNEFQGTMQALRNEVLDKEIATVLILVGNEDGYRVANETSYIGNLLKLAGGLNVFGSEHGEAYIEVSEEEMGQANPDIIIRLASSSAEGIQEMFDEEFATNEMWGSLEAVVNEEVYDLTYQVFGSTPQLDYQESIHQLKDILYK